MTFSTDRLAALIALASATTVLAVGIAWGTFAAGGSDSTCYLGAARLFAQGTTHLDRPLARTAPWPNADWTFTPAGHVPSRVGRGLLVPMCPPGLPLVMAAFGTVGLNEFLVVPLLGALAVWLTFLVGRRIDRPLTGAAAAVLVACSPIFLYQIVQPMTDVPATAWWMLVVALALGVRDETGHPFWAGVATSMAVLTRPNLAPLAAVIAVYFAASGRGWTRLAAVGRFAAGALPGVVVLALIQRSMYGGALASGYGSAGELFSTAFVIPNLKRYPTWLISTHTPFLLLALAGPFVVRRAAHAWMGLALAGLTLACYLPYYVFNDWWYIRFLLPAIPVLVILSVTVVIAVLARVGVAASIAGGIACVSAVAGWWLHMAQVGHAFELRRLDRPFVEAGTFVADRLPDRAVVLTVKHSGSVYYYANHPTILWDMLEPAKLDQALTFLQEQGYQPYLLLETDEEHLFRERFGGVSWVGWLDWPPAVQIGQRIRVYDPRDRARFLTTGEMRTEFVWENRLSSRQRRGKSGDP